MNDVERYIKEAKHIVVFSGAGFSTESNIPDFRSSDGLYQKQTYPYPCEVMLSHDFFMHHQKEFYTFYRNEMLYLEAQPNKAHKALAKLEAQGKLLAIITQNVDGLHQKAGNNKVIELHGSVHRNYCTKCHAFYDAQKIANAQTIPCCDRCGSVIKPDVVLYQEGLQTNVVNAAIEALQKADLLIVAGTSLVVYPAAGLLQYYKNKKMILINHDVTSADAMASVICRENIGDVLDFINHQ